MVSSIRLNAMRSWRAAVRVALAAAIVSMSACTGNVSSNAATHVTLTVATSQAPWNPAYAQLVQQYEKETGNTVVLRNFPNPDVKTQEVNDIQGQQHVFDVFQINEQDLPQFNDSGWIQPFTKVDPSFTIDPNIYSYSNVARWDSSKKVFDSSGDITNLPLLGNVDLFVYRKDIYQQLGLSVPTTWDQVIANGKAIQAANAARYGGVFRTQGVAGTYAISFEFQALLDSAGGAWFADPGTNWTPTANSSAGIQAATWLHELAALGPAATTTMGQAQVIAEVQNGDAGQSYLVAAAAAQLEDAASSSVGGKIGYAPLPLTPSGASSSATGLWSLAIPAGLPDARAKAALEYIKWMTSKDAQTLFAQDGGIPVRSDAYSPSGISDPSAQALKAVQDTAAKLPPVPTSLRYSFSTDMLNITEPGLQNIAAGQNTPQEGMQQIQDQLQNLIKTVGLPEG